MVRFRRDTRHVTHPASAFERDDAGHPLGVGMPGGSSLREDGDTHREGWMRILRADPCAYCGAEGGTVDHIEPRSLPAAGLGGAHSWLNYAGACVGCNSAKAARPLLEALYRRRWGTGYPLTRDRRAA